MGNAAEKLKKPLVLNKPGRFEFIGDIINIGVGDALRAGLVARLIKRVHRLVIENVSRQGDDRRERVLVERERIARRHPRKARQHDAYTQHKREIHQPAQTAGAVFMALADRTVIPLGDVVAGVVAALVRVLVDQELVHRLYRLAPGMRARRRVRCRCRVALILRAEYLIHFINIVRHFLPPLTGWMRHSSSLTVRRILWHELQKAHVYTALTASASAAAPGGPSQNNLQRGERDQTMFCGCNNNCGIWILILIIILFCCGGCGCNNGCGCGCDCGCGNNNNGCGCC